MIEQFRQENFNLFQLNTHSVLTITLQAGLSSLKTPYPHIQLITKQFLLNSYGDPIPNCQIFCKSDLGPNKFFFFLISTSIFGYIMCVSLIVLKSRPPVSVTSRRSSMCSVLFVQSTLTSLARRYHLLTTPSHTSSVPSPVSQ